MTAPTPAPAARPPIKPAPKPSAKKAAKAAPAPAKKTAPAAKTPTKAGPKKAAPKANANGTPRTVSTISKDGTQKCEHSGEVLPVTAFPTVRQADGSYVRGTVARKHLAAYREQRKTERATAKAAAAKAKADKATAAAK